MSAHRYPLSHLSPVTGLVGIIGLTIATLVFCQNTAFASYVSVDCAGNTSSAFRTISAALASLDRNGPNTITVSGTCHNEGLLISGFSFLTIQAAPSTTAIISQDDTGCEGEGGPPALMVVDSHMIVLAQLTFRGGTGVVVNDAEVEIRGVTIEHSYGHGINIQRGSVTLRGRVGLGGVPTPNTLQNNCGAGARVGPGGQLTAYFGTTIQNNLVGLSVFGTATLSANTDVILIQNNMGYGVRVFYGRVEFRGGQTKVQNNGVDPLFESPAGIWGAAGALIDAQVGPLEVSGNRGPGIWADISTSVLLGMIVTPSTTNSTTITGNTAEGLRLTHMSSANAFAGTTITGNGGADATCDGTSFLFGNVGGIRKLKCLNVDHK